MKCCLNSRLPASYLSKADEISVEARDHKIIPDLFEKYPKATVIYRIPYGEDIPWKEIKNYNILGQGRFVVCAPSVDLCKKLTDIEVKNYYGFPVSTMYELRALLKLNVEYVRIGIPLFFNMPQLKLIVGDTKIRLVPNVAYNDGLPREDGVCGQWIRPEDLELYDPYAYVIEFEDCDAQKETALFRIYMEEKSWPGDLGFIITNFNHTGVNRMITPDITKIRLSCGQKCQTRSACHMCYTAMILADPERIKDYQESVVNS